MLKKIKKGLSNFFENSESSQEEDEVSLKTLIIVFVIGLLIIGGLYFFNRDNNNRIINEEFISEDYQVDQKEILPDIKQYYSNSNSTEESIDNCFYMVNLIEHKEDILVGLLNNQSDKNTTLVSNMVEIVIRTDRLYEEINRVIIKLKSNTSSFLFSVGDGSDLRSEKTLIRTNNLNNWELVTINTTDLFENNYNFITIETSNENQFLYLDKLLLCE